MERITPYRMLILLIGAVTALSGLSFPRVARADQTEQIDIDQADEPWTEEQLTGDWGGLREQAAAAGIHFDPYLVVNWSKNIHGGLDTQGDAWRHVFSFNVTFELDTLLDWESGKVFVDFHNRKGQNGSDEVGDFQFVDNWDADGLTQINELWLEYELLEGAIRLKIGKVDANWEFAYTELGWEFVHGSASYPATNALIPTWPEPATSVNIFLYPDDFTSIGFGIYDGALQEGIRTGSRGPKTFFDDPGDLYLIIEVAKNWYIAGMPGRLVAGGWRHTGTFDRFDGGTESGTSGFHLVLDQMLWCEHPTGYNEAGFDVEGIGFFFQYDQADGDVMQIDQHIGIGLTWRGLIVNRDNDLIGLGLSWVHFTDDANATFTDNSETALEIFYKAQVTPAITVQPFVQHIANPGGEGTDDAVNVGVRSEVTF